MSKKQKELKKIIKKYEEALKVAIYEAVDIKELEKMEQYIKNCNDNLRTLVNKATMFYFDIRNSKKKRLPFNIEEYKIFEQNLKNDDKLKRRISDEIENCKKWLFEFQKFYQFVENLILVDYNYIRNDKKGRTTSTLLKLENGILEIDEDVSFRDNVKQFINLLKDYLNKTRCFPYYYSLYPKQSVNIITKELQKMCLKYCHRYKDLNRFYKQLRLTIIEQRSFMLSYLSKQYHEKYFKKARVCFAWAFIWFVVTSLPIYTNLPAGILGWINANFKPTLVVCDEWLQYIVWITIKTPSIILAWIGLSYLRAADRHDQDAKELSNLYQYKSMITDPVTQDALMVALAPNYFGTKRNRRSDNNFMEKLLLKMIPTLNINAGGESNNGNNGGQNGGKTD